MYSIYPCDSFMCFVLAVLGSSACANVVVWVDPIICFRADCVMSFFWMLPLLANQVPCYDCGLRWNGGVFLLLLYHLGYFRSFVLRRLHHCHHVDSLFCADFIIWVALAVFFTLIGSFGSFAPIAPGIQSSLF